MKDEVPLANGFQPLDNVGAPKSRMPAVKTKTKNIQGDSSILWKCYPHFSFISTSGRVVTAKCYLATTVLEVGSGPQHSSEGVGPWLEQLPNTHLLPR